MPSLALCADVLFPTGIAYQSAGGPGFNTTGITGGGGQTVRLMRWSEDLGRWDLVYGIKEIDDVRFVRDFHTARRGKFQSFLFYDHEDHESVGAILGTGNGVITEFQLVKEYFDGPDVWTPNTPYVVGDKTCPTVYTGQIFVCIKAGTSGNAEPTWDVTVGAVTTDNTAKWSALQGPDVYAKTLEKPIPGTIVVYKNNVAAVEFTDYTVNYFTGTITFLAAPAGGVIITADCEFYRKVNFDIDQVDLQQQLHNAGIIQHLPIVEERPAA